MYGFDAVPTLVLTEGDGTVLARFEGWVKQEWLELVRHAVDACVVDEARLSDVDTVTGRLPNSRPGCGSRAHDPDVARRLAVAHGALTLGSRRVQIPLNDDPFEFLADHGLTDGLPVVPPTEDRVVRMLSGTSRAPSEIIAHVPPNLAPATVEKVAINAVMAGCRPEYLPVVLAAVEAACTNTSSIFTECWPQRIRRPCHRGQRTDQARAWCQLWRQRVWPGFACQRNHRTGPAAGGPKRRWRPAARGRHVHARSTREVHLLHRRERGSELLGSAPS